MKYFEIEYIQAGKRDKIILSYSNKLEAIQGFKSKSLGVFLNIDEVSEPFALKIGKLKERLKDKFRAKKLPLEPYIATLRQISTMLNAGLPITLCLEDAIKTTNHKRMKEIFTIVLQEVESGINLSNAFEDFKDEVGAISIAMLDLGEKTGTLDESIEKLAEILQE
ncbi:MAG: type II secretion system F family protein, partial [Campylobacteraceae bacterium]|nr:type II secretion system F family protein [Campylobacteraceae bacterium]